MSNSKEEDVTKALNPQSQVLSLWQFREALKQLEHQNTF